MTEGLLFKGHDAPHADDDDYFEVPPDSARGEVVDRLQKNLISVKTRDADKYNDQTRYLLHMCIHLMPLKEQQGIERRLDELVSYLRMPRNKCVAKL
jgi:hypothetical protein